jgi:hypothetical protein
MNIQLAKQSIYRLFKQWGFKPGEIIKLGSIAHMIEGLDSSFTGDDVNLALNEMARHNEIEIITGVTMKLTEIGFKNVNSVD